MNESLKRGKAQASKSRLQLGLNLIGYRDDKSFLDKSQCELKQNQSRVLMGSTVSRKTEEKLMNNEKF